MIYIYFVLFRFLSINLQLKNDLYLFLFSFVFSVLSYNLRMIYIYFVVFRFLSILSIAIVIDVWFHIMCGIVVVVIAW